MLITRMKKSPAAGNENLATVRLLVVPRYFSYDLTSVYLANANANDMDEKESGQDEFMPRPVSSHIDRKTDCKLSMLLSIYVSSDI